MKSYIILLSHTVQNQAQQDGVFAKPEGLTTVVALGAIIVVMGALLVKKVFLTTVAPSKMG